MYTNLFYLFSDTFVVIYNSYYICSIAFRLFWFWTAQLDSFNTSHDIETSKLLDEVTEADLAEDEAVHGMTDEEAERMLQRLESEAQIKGDGVEKEMTMGRERLRRKLLARQKQKMYVFNIEKMRI